MIDFALILNAIDDRSIDKNFAMMVGAPLKMKPEQAAERMVQFYARPTRPWAKSQMKK